ncbi:MAG: ribonuclease III [Nitrospirae bacterium]|nr:ribonuclease III [Candidatus Manganitrophaceae bacterium]
MKPKSLSFLETALFYIFRNPSLLQQALTHKSYVNETKEKDRKDNERFEFLGDAVLDLVMCQELVERFPALPEGDLSKMKAKMVSEAVLAGVARQINLGAYLFLGKGEIQSEGQEKPSLLSDALEALIAAIYLDSGSHNGLSEARRVILSLFFEVMQTLTGGELLFDYKTTLQEYSQKKFASLPVYRLINESGPDHEKQFEVGVFVDESLCGIGLGKSKKVAEQEAAQKALSEIKTQ